MKEVAESLIQRMDAIVNIHDPNDDDFSRVLSEAAVGLLDGELTETEVRLIHRAAAKKLREDRKGITAMKKDLRAKGLL